MTRDIASAITILSLIMLAVNGGVGLLHAVDYTCYDGPTRAPDHIRTQKTLCVVCIFNALVICISLFGADRISKAIVARLESEAGLSVVETDVDENTEMVDKVFVPDVNSMIQETAVVDYIANYSDGTIYAKIDTVEHGSLRVQINFGVLSIGEKIKICYYEDSPNELYLYYDDELHEIEFT